MYYAKPTALTFVSAQTCSNVTVSNMDAIGEGAYAQVYKCEMMGYELVLKVLNFNMNSPSELKIVKDCYDRYESGDRLTIVEKSTFSKNFAIPTLSTFLIMVSGPNRHAFF